MYVVFKNTIPIAWVAFRVLGESHSRSIFLVTKMTPRCRLSLLFFSPLCSRGVGRGRGRRERAALHFPQWHTEKRENRRKKQSAGRGRGNKFFCAFPHDFSSSLFLRYVSLLSAVVTNGPEDGEEMEPTLLSLFSSFPLRRSLTGNKERGKRKKGDREHRRPRIPIIAPLLRLQSKHTTRAIPCQGGRFSPISFSKKYSV